MKKRKSTGSTSEAMVDDNEREEEEEGDTAPACYPKRARTWSQLWMGIFYGDVNKQYTLVFGDANELALFLVMLMDRRYVVMQMN